MPSTLATIAIAAACQIAGAPDETTAPLDWRTEERAMLADYAQLTSEQDFIKAGEAYFDPNARWIIFQAIPAPEPGSEPDEFYSMYVAKLTYKGDSITGIEKPIRISPPGSANTCGYFHPRYPHFVMFGSTMKPPKAQDEPGYQRDSGRYRWAFPPEMEVCKTVVEPVFFDYKPESPIKTFPERLQFGTMFQRDGYDAECSSSHNARFVVHTSVDPETGDADLFVFDAKLEKRVPLVQKPGYDGGPFFSPDDKWVCYRSDRKGNNLLQLFACEVAYDESGAITGIRREVQLTDDENVNWAPFWHPSGRFLVYATSAVSHRNYEVFAIEFNPDKPMDSLAKKRITYADGFDGLPVFSNDGQWMMWTSQRGDARVGDQRPSSQIWVARFTAGSPD